MGSTHYIVNAVLNHILDIKPYTPPEHLYLALGTQASADENGNWPDELDPSDSQGLGYKRIKLCPMEPFQPLENAGMQNKYWLAFPRARKSWGMIRECGVYDAPNGGNLLFFSSLLEPVAVYVGDRVTAKPAELQFTYFSAENSFDPPNNSNIYACGYWIGQQVMKMLFQAFGFSPPDLQVGLHPNPGAGYAPVDCKGDWSGSNGTAMNTAEFDFPVALGNWNTSNIVIQVDEDRWVFTMSDEGGIDNTTPSVPVGDQGFIEGSAIVLIATAI